MKPMPIAAADDAFAAKKIRPDALIAPEVITPETRRSCAGLSALTMNVAGVVKDWLIIIASAYLFGNLVNGMQVGGYLFAFVGVIYYNQQRVLSKQREQEQREDAAKQPEQQQQPEQQRKEEREGLLDGVLVDGGAPEGGADGEEGDAAV